MGVIQTNEIVYDIDYDAFESKYDIFCIGVHVPRDNKKFYAGTTMLDKPLMGNKILAILNTVGKDGRNIYILMQSNPDNHYILQEILRNDKYYDDITLRKCNAKNIEPSYFLQLCFNGLAHNPDVENECDAWNLTGKLLLFSPGLIDSKYDKNKQVHAIQLKIARDMKLQLNVVTLTKLSAFTHLDIEKAYPNGCIYYKLDTEPSLVMRRIFSAKPTDDNIYIQRQFKGVRYPVPFLSLLSFDSFLSSKMGILYSAMRMFKRQYGDMVRIGFSQIDDYKTLIPTPGETKSVEKRAISYLANKDIVLVNKTKDPDVDESLDELCSLLREEYKSNAVILSEPSDNNPSIVVIYDKSYYETADEEDPYASLAAGKRILQRLSVDTLKKIMTQIHGKKNKAMKRAEEGKRPSASDKNYSLLRNLIYQIIIKEDIQAGVFTLYDWNMGDMQFGLRYKEDNKVDKIVEMNVADNGTFSIKYKNPLQISFLDEPLDYDMHGKEMEITSGNNVFTIDVTGWYTIPNIEGIADRLRKHDTNIKNEEARDLLLSSCLDIKLFTISENEFAYFVGEKGKGLSSSIRDAANIRIIRMEKGEEGLSFLENKLLPMFNAPFVRNNQLTVLPFVFKYMREWLSVN